MVDVVGAGFVEAPERIVRQRRKVDDGVEAAEVGRRDVADVLADRRHRRRLLTEIAAFVEIRVEAGDVVTGLASTPAMTEPI